MAHSPFLAARIEPKADSKTHLKGRPVAPLFHSPKY